MSTVTYVYVLLVLVAAASAEDCLRTHKSGLAVDVYYDQDCLARQLRERMAYAEAHKADSARQSDHVEVGHGITPFKVVCVMIVACVLSVLFTTCAKVVFIAQLFHRDLRDGLLWMAMMSCLSIVMVWAMYV